METDVFLGYTWDILKKSLEHIWFEPQFTFYQPSGPGMPLNYGLGAQFRFYLIVSKKYP